MINWTPELDENGELKGVVYPRNGYFDSALTVQPDSCINMLKIMYLIIPFVLDAIITFILSRMKVEEANEKLRTELNH